jgi:membrane-associated protein
LNLIEGAGMDVALLLHSAWLLPVLALDGPFPVLPSEPLLMTASAVAFGGHDVPMARWPARRCGPAT